MTDIKDLLAFRFNQDHFSQSAKRVYDKDAPPLVDLERTIKKIVDKYETLGELTAPKSGRALKLFWQNADKGLRQLETVFTSRLLLVDLAYSLTFNPSNFSETNRFYKPIIESHEIKLALELFNNNWSPRYLEPLITALLEHWNKLPKNALSQLSQSCIKQLMNYQGKRRDYLIFKKQAILLAENGPEELAKVLIYNNIGPEASFKTFHINTHTATWQYLQRFIEHYSRKAVSLSAKKEERVKQILDFLYLQKECKPTGTIDSVKQCIVILVNTFKPGYITEFDKTLHQAAYDLIGDPNDDVAWGLYAEANEKEQRARDILNNHISHLFLLAFFKTIAGESDERRLNFWKRYSKDFGFVKVFCSSNLKSRLLRLNPDIEPYAKSRIGSLIKYWKGPFDGSVAAFCTQVNKYVLIEFNQIDNAFYAYKENTNICPEIHKEEVTVSYLKRTTSVPIISKNTWKRRDEGRLFHNQGWEFNLEKWLAWWVKI